MSTQIDKVLHHMRAYGSISTVVAFEKYRITRLSALIQFIEARGIPVYTKTERNNRTRWTLYSLKQFDLF